MSNGSICSACGKEQDFEISREIEWIECSICHKWYHIHCVGIRHSELDRIREYHCVTCSKVKGPSLLTRISSRRHKRIDYVALNEGQSRIELNHHPRIDDFKNFKNDKPLGEMVYLVDPKVDGSNGGIFTDKDLLRIVTASKFKKPILVRGCNPEIPASYDENVKLSLKLPNFSIDQLTKLIGIDRKVPVMDVLSQNMVRPRWSMNRWRSYYKEAQTDRSKILNILSMEFSNTALSEHVEIPEVVQKLDILTRIFKSELGQALSDAKIARPKVTEYLLMSAAESFTDFHIDFAGTSVYYSIISGKKQFMLYPPTSRNLDIYTKWCNSDEQSSIWFGDLIPRLTNAIIKNEDLNATPEYMLNGCKIEISAGDLLLLPSGWIHAVYTPCDSLIIGGNFLNLFSLDNHIKVFQIERETNVPEKFCFPDLNRMLWLIGFYVVEQNLSVNAVLSQQLLCLLKYYKAVLASEPPAEIFNKLKDAYKRSKRSIPTKVIGDPSKFVARFQNWMESAVGHRLPMNKKRRHSENKSGVSSKLVKGSYGK